MEWWQIIVTISGIAFCGISGWALKLLIEIKAEVCGINVWRRGIDKRLAALEAQK